MTAQRRTWCEEKAMAEERRWSRRCGQEAGSELDLASSRADQRLTITDWSAPSPLLAPPQ
jgi:hypothetical protein